MSSPRDGPRERWRQRTIWCMSEWIHEVEPNGPLNGSMNEWSNEQTKERISGPQHWRMLAHFWRRRPPPVPSLFRPFFHNFFLSSFSLFFFSCSPTPGRARGVSNAARRASSTHSLNQVHRIFANTPAFPISFVIPTHET